MSESRNVLQDKGYALSLRTVKLYQFLNCEKKEHVLAKQILRSGTSVGANIEEALGCQSKKDFFAKISIVYKELRETRFWINLLRDSNYLDERIAISFLEDIEELLKITGKIRVTLKS